MTTQHTEMSTDELSAGLGSPEWTVIDVRSPDAYNGWRLRDESRGGHIPGATSLPGRWRGDADLATVLRERGVTPDRSLVLYGYDDTTVEAVAETLAESGFDRLAVYTEFLDEWVPDATRPLERLDRYWQLVPPEWVRKLTRGSDPPSSPEGEHVVCHVHAGDEDEYRAGHVPGSVPLNTRRFESPDDWNRRPPAELEATLLDHGIRHDTTVVLYGRPADLDGEYSPSETTPGHMGAMRCATILLYAGVEDVRIMNGGLGAWNALGFDLTTEPIRRRRVESFGTTVPARPGLFIDTPEAKAWLAADDRDVVSVRSYEELALEGSGYDYISEEGRIPGTIHAPSGSDVHHVEEYRNPDETMREYHEVADLWAEQGIDPGKRLAFCCGTGWRASEAFVNAYLMGWTKIAVYDGGWYEWSGDPENPIEGVDPSPGGGGCRGR